MESYPVPDLRLALNLGSHYFAGILWGCSLDQGLKLSSPVGSLLPCFSVFVLNQADNPRRLVPPNDDFYREFALLPIFNSARRDSLSGST